MEILSRFRFSKYYARYLGTAPNDSVVVVVIAQYLDGQHSSVEEEHNKTFILYSEL